MYQDNPITGTSLSEKTLCLTFDDGPGETRRAGPGPHTVELAQYLYDQGIPATFFMTGKFASSFPEIVSQVSRLGHLIGNHTYDHPYLDQYSTEGGDVVFQVTTTDGALRRWIDSPTVFLRPPYGSWNSTIASTLNSNLTASLSHIGPINWDIDGQDWACWRDKRDPQDCSNGYLKAIEKEKRGIVLMHDCTADWEIVKHANRALELVNLIVPALKQKGYNFVRLDKIPDIVALSAKTTYLALQGSNDLYVSPQGGGGGKITVTSKTVGTEERLVIDPLVVENLCLGGKVALQAPFGQYFSPQQGGGGDVLATAPKVGEQETLDPISLGGNKVAFRTITGNFLTYDTAATLRADSEEINAKSVFTYKYLP